MSLELLPQELLYLIFSEIDCVYELKLCNKVLYNSIKSILYYVEHIFSELVIEWKVNTELLIQKLVESNNIICIKYLCNNYKHLFLLNKINMLHIIKYASINGNKDIIDWITGHGTYVYKIIICESAKAGNIDLLLSSLTNYPKYTEYAISYAARSGKFEVINTIIELGYNINDYVTIARNSAKAGNIDIFKWSFEKCKDAILYKYDNYTIAKSASIGANIEILKILKNSNISLGYYAVYGAAKYNRTNVLDWIISYVGKCYDFNEALIEGCIVGNHMNTIFMYIDRIENINLPLKKLNLIECAIKHNNVRLLKYVHRLVIIQNNLNNFIKTCNIAARYGSMNIIEWAYLDFYTPELNSIAKNATQYLQFDTLKWALDNGANNLNKLAIAALKCKYYSNKSICGTKINGNVIALSQYALVEYLIRRGANNFVEISLKALGKNLKDIFMLILRNYFDHIKDDIKNITLAAIKNQMFDIVDMLLYKCYFDLSDIIPYFVKYNIFNNYIDIIGERTNNFTSTIIEGIKCKNVDVIKYVIENHRNKCDLDDAILSLQSFNGISCEIMELLINSGITNYSYIFRGALQVNNSNLVDLIIKRVNVNDINDVAALFARRGMINMIKKLINYGANNFNEIAINAVNGFCSDITKLKIIEIAIECGANNALEILEAARIKNLLIVVNYLTEIIG